MILFKDEHVAPILAGTKTQTRRLGLRRWNVGAVHKCYTKPPYSKGSAKAFASVLILDVRQERLFSISRDDALAEGYDSQNSFFDAFCAINGMEAVVQDPLVWVVRFERVGGDGKPAA